VSAAAIVIQHGVSKEIIPLADVLKVSVEYGPRDEGAKGAELHIQTRYPKPLVPAFASVQRQRGVEGLYYRLQSWMDMPDRNFDLNAEWNAAEVEAGI
jgi:hypothetical protein